MSKNLSIAQIGLGRWGQNVTRNLSLLPNANLSIIYDSDEKIARSTAQMYGCGVATSYEEILYNQDICAIVITTPSNLHFEHTMKALEAGKHVFVEKPLAMTLDDAVLMNTAAEKGGLKLQVGHIFLHNEIVHKVKDYIKNGELGDVQYIYCRRLNLGQFRKDTDVVWTLAPHDISIVNFLLDSRPQQVSARSFTFAQKPNDNPEVCFAHLDFPEGRQVHLHLSLLDPQKQREIVIIGNKKMLIYDDTDPKMVIQIYDKRVETEHFEPTMDFHDFATRIRAGDMIVPNVKTQEPLFVELTRFADSIISDSDPLSGGRQGVDIVAIMEAISLSASQNGRNINVEYPVFS